MPKPKGMEHIHIYREETSHPVAYDFHLLTETTLYSGRTKDQSGWIGKNKQTNKIGFQYIEYKNLK